MPRRREIPKRYILPDPIFNNVNVSKFINALMRSGKKSVSENIVYSAFNHIKKKYKKNPIEVFSNALNNCQPMIEVKTRRIGGNNYQVPVEIRDVRRTALSMRWIKESSKKRSEKSMSERLGEEIVDACKGSGNAVKKKDEVHKMAESNKAFSHFRL